MSNQSYFWVSLWGFILELIQVIIYFSYRRLAKQQSRAHLFCSLVILAGNLLLMITNWLLAQPQPDEEMIHMLLWLISFDFLLSAPMLSWYAASMFYYDHTETREYYLALIPPFIPMAILLGICGPLLMVKGNSVVFTNQWVEALFLVDELYYFVLAVVEIKRYKECLGTNQARMVNGLMFMTVVAYSVIYDTRNPSIFAATLSLLALYSIFTVQGSTYYFHRTSGVRNNNAYRTSFVTRIVEKKKFRILLVHSESKREYVMSENGNLDDVVSSLITDALKQKVQEKPLFMLRNDLFAVLLEEDEIEETTDLIIDIREKLEEMLKKTGRTNQVRIHFCTVDVPDQVHTYNELKLFHTLYLDRADLKNYDLIDGSEIKLQEEIEHRRKVSEIMQALEDGNIEAYYQPILDYKKNKIVAGEALVRMKTGENEAVTIGPWIPTLEKYGLILKLDAHVMKQAMDFVASKECVEAGIETIDVNLSIEETLQTNSAENIINYSKKIGLDPKRLIVEILESNDPIVMRGMQAAMKKLNAEGFRLSLDDFGTGYSNISRLLSFPVHIVKIDRSLLLEAMESELGNKILTGLVPFIHDMNKKIVVEGVETKEEEALVKKLGIDYGQGWLYAKAMPGKDFLEFTRNYNQTHG